MTRSLPTLAVLALLAAPAAWADDRPPTDEERAQIESVLQAEGYTSWEEIEFDDGVWEVDDAVGADGARYDLRLDTNFAIISVRPD